MSIKLIAISLIVLGCSLIVTSLPTQCPSTCDPSKCLEPVDCFAGLIKDKCNCCSICGQFEGNRCDLVTSKGLNESHRVYGDCGENLECRLRDDLDPSEPDEALCFCVKTEMVCGSDGQTYDNLCQLNEARYKRRDGLVPNNYGPCQSAPKIVSKPENLNGSLGDNTAFMCQAIGWPIPTITWRVLLKNTHEVKQFNNLPADDPHIAVQYRGGSKPLEVTSWLQIIGVRVNDEGEYHCIATNELGDTFNYGVLTVTHDKPFISSEKSVNHVNKE